MSNVLLAVLLTSGIGFALIGLGLVVSGRTRRFLTTGCRADGVVTALVPRTNMEGPDLARTTYAPSVEFTAQTGALRSFTSATAASRPAYRVGQHVVVVYDPRNPRKAIILSFGEVWLVPLILWGLGALFMLIGMLVAFGT